MIITVEGDCKRVDLGQRIFQQPFCAYASARASPASEYWPRLMKADRHARVRRCNELGCAAETASALKVAEKIDMGCPC